MNYILFDGDARDTLLPFTYTRPVADIRIGILTIREKWEKYLGLTVTTSTEEYLEEKYPMVEMRQNILISASFLPTEELAKSVKNLSEKETLLSKDGILIAFYGVGTQEEVDFNLYEEIIFKGEALHIENTWDIFFLNDKAIQLDFELLTKGRTSQPIPKGVNYINREAIFIEEGASVIFASLNASKGSIYIGKNAQIMEGSLIRGPFAACENSVVKMGAKIYGATTIGPHCKVGGEINNSVLFSNSNKGHDGFLGNSVIGEWCNLGAGTNNSNLKNDYTEVKLWSYKTGVFAKTGLQFCGLMMGDYSKCGINTMFNTGTVIGVSTNIFGSDFPRNFIPSFSRGSTAGFTTYKLKKVFDVADVVMKRKGLIFDKKEQKILEYVFELSAKYRNY